MILYSFTISYILDFIGKYFYISYLIRIDYNNKKFINNPMENKTLVVWDVEWYFNHFNSLMVNPQICDIANTISLILVWDIVGRGKDGNIPMLRFCLENQERTRMVLWNKDLLVQKIHKWEGPEKTPTWAKKLAKKLWKSENSELLDYFMSCFKPYIEKDDFTITHARPLAWKNLSEHTLEELSWYDDQKRKKWIYIEDTTLIHGHHAKEWVNVNLNPLSWGISSIGIDSWVWRWTWILSGVLLWKKKLRILNSQWTVIQINR